MPPIKLSRIERVVYVDAAQHVLIEQDAAGRWDAYVTARHIGEYPTKVQALTAAQAYVDRG